MVEISRPAITKKWQGKGKDFSHNGSTVQLTFQLNYRQSTLMIKNKIIQKKHNKIKIPTCRGEPVGYLKASMAENMNSGQPRNKSRQ